ncbi:MAG: hypothetical protein LBN18_06345 [Dysgonamonadaceae bacterium]|jgi:hypothetical protein|nr:hypothetical protein [Dysgonamonadaceae bacterium]
MYQKSTPDEYYYRTSETENDTMYYEPQQDTVTWLMQFACVYHVEKGLPGSLSGIILN